MLWPPFVGVVPKKPHRRPPLIGENVTDRAETTCLSLGRKPLVDAQMSSQLRVVKPEKGMHTRFCHAI